MPVIAALDGYCLGGGAELAYAADFRIGTPGVRIGNPETGLGILAAAGASWRLKELVGEPVAKEILLAGAVLRADEALAVDLITEIHEPAQLMDAAHALADRIARQDPLAVRITKSVFHAPAEAHPADRPAGAGHPLRIPGQVRPHAGFLGQEVSQEVRHAPRQQPKNARATTPDLNFQPEPSATLPFPALAFPTSSACSAAAGWARASPTPS